MPTWISDFFGIGTQGISDRARYRSNINRSNVTSNFEFSTGSAPIITQLAVLDAWFPGHVTTNNLWATFGSNAPPGNIPVANDAAIGFTDLTAGDNGSLTGFVLASGSPGKNAAHDGTDCGCDIAALQTYTAGCESGVW